MHDVADLEAATKALLVDKSTTRTLVSFERESERYLTVVEIGEVTPDDPPRDAKKAWVPVDVQALTGSLAERLGLGDRTGVRVTRVLDDRAPLQVGDVILAIDDDPVSPASSNDDEVFASAIRRYRVGSNVTLTVSRDGREQRVPVQLVPTPSQPREMRSYNDPVFEFRARNLAEADGLDPRLRDASGAMVESVALRGWAALGHLVGGDLIVAIDGQPIRDVDALEGRMKDIEAKRPGSLVFEIKRGVRTMFIEFDPAWE